MSPNPALSAAPARHPIVDRAIKALRALASEQPEFLLAFMYVKHLLRAAPVGTACVAANGRISLDPAFCEPLSQAELGGVVAHELLHLIWMHFGRQGGRDMTRWNVAGDWCINATLRAAGVKLPAGVLYPAAEYHGELSAEEVYEYLLQNPSAMPQPGDEQGAGEGQGGEGEGAGQGQPQFGRGCGVKPAEGEGAQGEGSGAEGEGTPDWAQVARDTVAAAKAAGRGSSPVVRFLEPRQARQSWDKVLRYGTNAAVQASRRDVQTYSRCGRREIPGIIRPGYVAQGVNVAVLVDISGSMHGDWAEQILAEVQRILGAVRGLNIFLVSHTSQVEWAGWVKQGETAKIKAAMQATGGTDPNPAYEAAAKCGKRLDAVIHFTDCEFFGDRWPTVPAKRLVVGAFGGGAEGQGCKPPPNATVIPCDPRSKS